jgi:PAS domain S-box-containing protein
MIWQEIPYLIPLIMVSFFSLILGVYIWFRFRSPLGRTAAITILISTEWIITSLLSLAGGDLQTKVFWAKMQYPGIVLLPVVWFIFAVVYTGREKWLTYRTLGGLSCVPVITVLLAFTNEHHHLIWSSFTVTISDSLLVAEKTFGAWLWIFIGYAYLVLLTGAFLFFTQIRTCSRPSHRRQTSILVIGAMIPWGATVLLSFGLNPFPHLDLTLVALTMTNLIVAFAIFHFRLGDVVPLAREIIFESMNDSIIVLDTEHNIVDANPAAQKLLGGGSELIGNPAEIVWPEWSSKGLDNIAGSKEIILDEQRIYDVTVSPLVDWRDRTVSKVVALRDVTDRKRSENLKQSLEEKEILLQEIHHRVKNNIQVISSLIQLQSRHIKDEKYREMFKESRDRIRSMALVHERLYQSENLANIDFNKYIRDLAYNLRRSYGATGIVLNVECDVSLGIDTAIPCGLIINELISNSLKHAFPGNREGEIRIVFHSLNENIELIVCDNGVGLPDGMDFRNTESLGLHLVTILAEGQLRGEISVDTSKGTMFRIVFQK